MCSGGPCFGTLRAVTLAPPAPAASSPIPSPFPHRSHPKAFGSAKHRRSQATNDISLISVHHAFGCRDMSEAGPSRNNGKAPALADRQPSNLRFQRRTSERAFYEGALRDGTIITPTMDYSSPWASSPDANRSGISDAGVPSHDPLPAPALEQSGVAEGALTANGQEHATPQQYGGPAGQSAGWEERPQQQWQGQQAPRNYSEENRRPQSARYHQPPPQQQQQQQPQAPSQQGAMPPQQRQHVPQYKLQAKLTSLERTGKKDPILRFDVYVCQVYSLMSVSPSMQRTPR